jgi:hypothetical protein
MEASLVPVLLTRTYQSANLNPILHTWFLFFLNQKSYNVKVPVCDWARDFVNSVWLFNKQTSIERSDEIVVHSRAEPQDRKLKRPLRPLAVTKKLCQVGTLPKQISLKGRLARKDQSKYHSKGLC